MFKIPNNLRNLFLKMKSKLILNEEGVLKKDALVGVVYQTQNDEKIYDLAKMGTDHFGLELYFLLHSSDKKIYENPRKCTTKDKVLKWKTIQEISREINKKYKNDNTINMHSKVLSEKEIEIIKKELPNLF